MMDRSDRTEQRYWFILSGKKMLVRREGEKVSIPLLGSVSELGLTLPALQEHDLGTLNGHRCHAAEVTEGTGLPAGMALNGVWGLFNHIDKDLFKMALKAVHILDWNRTDRFCTRCGAPNRPKADERAKECPQCGYVSFPRLSPAVIMLVANGDELLLAHAHRFTEERYSVLAGFVEPGETLEEAVQREVKEEVGIDVTDIRYFGSQHWPFPDSLMIAFTARYAGGTVRVDPSEIIRAGWFHYSNLPTIPGRISIARQMIDWFVAECEAAPQGV
jgi:NAD+ diphosphatase